MGMGALPTAAGAFWSKHQINVSNLGNPYCHWRCPTANQRPPAAVSTSTREEHGGDSIDAQVEVIQSAQAERRDQGEVAIPPPLPDAPLLEQDLQPVGFLRPEGGTTGFLHPQGGMTSYLTCKR